MSDLFEIIGEAGIEETLKRKAVSKFSFSGGEWFATAPPKKLQYFTLGSSLVRKKIAINYQGLTN